MKNTLILTFIFFCNCVFAQTPANDPHWVLLWQDEFNSFDSNKWVKADNCDHNGEPQMYKPDNVDIYYGKLRFRLLNQTASCGSPITSYVCGGCNPDSAHNYTSGWVNTKEAFNMQYGYAEARILFPYGNGLWPAFWLWSAASRYEEIDVIELFPGMKEIGNNIYNNQRHNQYMNTSHLHYNVTNGSSWSTISQNYIYPINNYNDWHIYGIEWSPNKIILYVDGIAVNNVQNPQISDTKYIIFNLSLLRRNVILGDPKYCDIIYPYTGIPAEMLVDYLRVYNINSNCSSYIWACNYNFNNHINEVKSVISIGGTGCTNNISTNQSITLRARDYVIINGDFSVPLGAELYIDCNNPCY